MDAIAAVRAASAVPLIGGVVLAGKGQQRFGLLLVPLAYTWSPLDRHAQELLTKRLRQRAAQHPGQIAYDPEMLRRAGANLLTATLLYLAVTSFATNA